MSNKEKTKFLILKTVGNFLLLFAIAGVIFTFGPALYFEVKFKIIEVRGITYEVPKEVSAFGELAANQQSQQDSRAQPQNTGASFADLLTGPKEQILNPPDTEFSIVIPKIGATSKVVANVDPGNKDEYLPALQNKGVAHAKGTVFPGLEGITYLFAHSADNFWNAGRYNAIFYMIKDLVPGDEIYVFFEGERYGYVVTDSKIVDPKDVSFITEAQISGEQLILQTCWPPGTTWERLLVFASPMKSDTTFK